MNLTKKEKRAILRACEYIEKQNGWSCIILKYMNSGFYSLGICPLVEKYRGFFNMGFGVWKYLDDGFMFSSEQRIIALLLFYYAHGDVE